MTRRTALPLMLLLASSLLPAGAAAAPTSETVTAISWQQAEDRDHPRSHLLPVVVPRPFHGGARVCGYYENDAFHEPQDGRVMLNVSLWRGGVRIARFGFGRRSVRFNSLDLGCRSVPRLRRGDTLLFDFRFSEMPRLSPRPFSHGGFVNTYMLVRATVEPPPAEVPSAIELLSVEPALGSRIPGGSMIRVRVRYTCSQPLGCNVAAGFSENGDRRIARGVLPGTRGRTLILRCTESRSDLVMSGLTVEIERQAGDVLDRAEVAGGITCIGSGFD